MDSQLPFLHPTPSLDSEWYASNLIASSAVFNEETFYPTSSEKITRTSSKEKIFHKSSSDKKSEKEVSQEQENLNHQEESDKNFSNAGYHPSKEHSIHCNDDKISVSAISPFNTKNSSFMSETKNNEDKKIDHKNCCIFSGENSSMDFQEDPLQHIPYKFVQMNHKIGNTFSYNTIPTSSLVHSIAPLFPPNSPSSIGDVSKKPLLKSSLSSSLTPEFIDNEKIKDGAPVSMTTPAMNPDNHKIYQPFLMEQRTATKRRSIHSRQLRRANSESQIVGLPPTAFFPHQKKKKTTSYSNLFHRNSDHPSNKKHVQDYTSSIAHEHSNHNLPPIALAAEPIQYQEEKWQNCLEQNTTSKTCISESNHANISSKPFKSTSIIAVEMLSNSVEKGDLTNDKEMSETKEISKDRRNKTQVDHSSILESELGENLKTLTNSPNVDYSQSSTSFSANSNNNITNMDEESKDNLENKGHYSMSETNVNHNLSNLPPTLYQPPLNISYGSRYPHLRTSYHSLHHPHHLQTLLPPPLPSLADSPFTSHHHQAQLSRTLDMHHFSPIAPSPSSSNVISTFQVPKHIFGTNHSNVNETITKTDDKSISLGASSHEYGSFSRVDHLVDHPSKHSIPQVERPQPNFVFYNTHNHSANSFQIGRSGNLYMRDIILSGQVVTDPKGRKYECSLCHKRFTRPSTLRTHMNSHTGERPFACTAPGCGWRFTVLSNLRRHMRVCPALKREGNQDENMKSGQNNNNNNVNFNRMYENTIHHPANSNLNQFSTSGSSVYKATHT